MPAVPSGRSANPPPPGGSAPVPPAPPELRTPFTERQLERLTPEDVKARQDLQQVELETVESTGSIFVDPEQVIVKPPLLTALITLNRDLSPLRLDAQSESEMNLSDVVKTALSNNLAIKITHTETQEHKWQYVKALSGFLPNIINSFDFQGLTGTYVTPAGAAVPIKNHFLSESASFQQYLFQGGLVLFSSLQNKHQYKASQFALKGTTNDVLLDATKLYYDLVLNDVLLQIRVKMVDVSRALVIRNTDMFQEGVNTQLDVLQAKYQLSSDRQHLIAQQIARRQAAVNLATALNLNQAVDIAVKHRTVAKVRLVDPSIQPVQLVSIAIDNRPELKRYEQLRLAAKDAIKVAIAPLFPQVSAVGNVVGTGAKAVAVNLNALQQTPLSTSGVGVGAVSGSSGLPLIPGPSAGRRWQVHPLYFIGLDIQWKLGGLAVQQAAQVQTARWQARKVQFEFLRELEKIQQQVRDAYLASLSAENLINETTDAVKYAEEGLRLSVLRFKEGVGTYLDVITAQRNYTAALIDKASAIIKFNTAQAQLLQAMGTISYNSLTSLTPMKE